MKNIVFVCATLVIFGSCFKKDINPIVINKYSLDKHSGSYTATVIHSVYYPDNPTIMIDTAYNVNTEIQLIDKAYVWEQNSLSDIKYDEALAKVNANTVHAGFCGNNLKTASLIISNNANKIIGKISYSLQNDNKSETWEYDLTKK
jgi:hypothetical protein